MSRYSASFVNTIDDGLIIAHVAGLLGFKGWTRYRVQSYLDGLGAELVEDAKLQCPVGFREFTKKEIEKNHPKALQEVMQHLIMGSK